MTAEDLHRSALADAAPPEGLGLPLRALWWAAKGEWTRAHEVAQEGEDADSAWAHAWLHRQEGDLSNADYWYRRAGRTRSPASLEAEWHAIAGALLAQGTQARG
ncbi:MAG: hypothetical protein K2X74_21190 [Acetobacteraceae bacterium]|nr:hypothetical protein [Acetobacteraceae bacterium]